MNQMLHEELTDRIIGAAITYLRLSGLRVGLLVNCNVEALKFGIKRIVK